jgi:hypothetical protein
MRDVYKEREQFKKKYFDEDKAELDLKGKQLCCLEEQDKHYHHQGAKSEFPKVGIFTDEELKSGAFLIHLMASLYLFAALAIVCDDYFVPALERISEELSLSEDVAGATFMAAGSSAPELFTSVIGVFVAKSDIGIGTIVGSAVFNILVIIGACGLFVPGDIHLSWWPLFRDSTFYLLTILLLLYVIFPEFDNDQCPAWEHKELFQCNDRSYFDKPGLYKEKDKDGNIVANSDKQFKDFCQCPPSNIPWGKCQTWRKKNTKKAQASSVDCSKPVESNIILPSGEVKKTGYYAKEFTQSCTCSDQTKVFGDFKNCIKWKPTKAHVESKYQCNQKNYRRDYERFLQECTCRPYHNVGRAELLSGDVAKCGKSEVFFSEACVMLAFYCVYILTMKYNEPLEALFSKCGSKSAEPEEEEQQLNGDGNKSRLIATPLLERKQQSTSQLHRWHKTLCHLKFFPKFFVPLVRLL